MSRCIIQIKLPYKRGSFLKSRAYQRQEELARQRALLVALSDDLALPLLQVKTGLELVDFGAVGRKTARAQAGDLALNIESALQLVAAYRLLLKSNTLARMVQAPVSIGAVLEEVAHQLSPYARQYATVIQVDVQGKFAPVLADGNSLAVALGALGSSLIRAQAAQSSQKNYRLVLGAHKGSEGLVAAGAFSDVRGLSDKSLRAARALVGQARQPLLGLPPGAASGILIADMLCGNLWQPLRASAHRHMGGLATALPISNQLQFV